MVACGLICLVVFLLATISSLKDTIACRKGLLRVMLLALPLPWIACELGWFVAEYGRQPWSIYEVLPVDLSVSSLSSTDLVFSIGGFVLLYSALLVVDLWLMTRFARLGPSTLGTGRYFFERKA